MAPVRRPAGRWPSLLPVLILVVVDGPRGAFGLTYVRPTLRGRHVCSVHATVTQNKTEVAEQNVLPQQTDPG